MPPRTLSRRSSLSHFASKGLAHARTFARAPHTRTGGRSLRPGFALPSPRRCRHPPVRCSRATKLSRSSLVWCAPAPKLLAVRRSLHTSRPHRSRHPLRSQQSRRCPQQVRAPASCLAKLFSSTTRANKTHRYMRLHALQHHSLPASSLFAVPVVRAAHMPLSVRAQALRNSVIDDAHRQRPRASP